MTRVLFDMHTSVTNSLNGKFNNLTRFAECLSRDPAYSVHAVYDRADGASIPVPYQFLRQWYYPQWGGLELRLRWALCLARTDADWLWTEIIPGRHSANPRWGPSRFTWGENTVLHVDFQHGDLHDQRKRIRRHRRFHVLTPAQRLDIVELGVDRDQVHVIPNPVDIPQFRRDGLERDGTILYVDGRDSDLRVLYRHIGRETPEWRRRLLMIDSDHRVGQEEYVRVLNTASIAICLTPSGDSTTTRLFEFAAAGLPFVTWPSRGMEPLLPSGTYEISKDEIQWTLDNQESLSKNLKMEAERFSYEATLMRMKDMFR